MGTVPWTVYAPTHQKEHWKLPDGLSWKTVEMKVKRLQMRIAKAAKTKQYRTMRSLQWLLAHSRLAKLLAVRRVTSSNGKNTPGIDGVVWKTSRQKFEALKTLRQRGYKASPLRRVYIPKKNGKLRPLGIPTMRDRAIQALYALTLEPVAETWADKNSYGFRPLRRCADAIEQIFLCLGQRYSAEWVLEADIASCFDTISHQWLLENIPVDKRILSQWLNAGFMDKGELFPTLRGTPQGGVISPLLMNMTLDGLEKTIFQKAPRNIRGTNLSSGINVIRYADDFVVTAKNPELLKERVLPVIETFLEERGLTLSKEKTHITHVSDGFTFLGQHVRKYKNGKLIIKPSSTAIKGLIAKLKQITKDHRGQDAWTMIERLNLTIRGWCNYHRHVCSADTFSAIDNWLFFQIKRWIHFCHPNKRWRWAKHRYYRFHNGTIWSFYDSKKNTNNVMCYRDLLKAASITIRRHVKIRAEVNPYDPLWNEYISNRKERRCTKSKRGNLDEETG